MDEPEGDLLKSRVEYSPPPAGTNMARELLAALKRNAQRTLLVDSRAPANPLTGREVLEQSGAIATGLVRKLSLEPNDTVMSLCERSATEALVAVGVLLAGGALYPALASDGYKEVEVLCELSSPRVMIASRHFRESALRLRKSVPGCRRMKIVLVDEWSATSGEGLREQNGGQAAPTARDEPKVACDENNNNNIDLQTDKFVYSLDELRAGAHDEQLIEQIARQRIRPTEHVATCLLTSGSTGRPKLVPTTHEEIVHGLYSMLSATRNPFPLEQILPLEQADQAQAQAQPQPPKQPVDANNNDPAPSGRQLDGRAQQVAPGAGQGPCFLLPLGPDDVVSGDLPMDHGAGLNIMFLSLCVGSKFIVMPSYDVDVFWRAATQYRVTISLSSTTFAYCLFKRLKQLIDARQTSAYDLSAFRLLGCCGAKMAFLELVQQVVAHESFAHFQVCQAYGCTELGFISMTLGCEGRSSRLLDSVGHLFPGLQAKVADYDNCERTLARGQRGELLLWSNSLFKRYISSPDDHASAERIFDACHDPRGLFYRTGDQAHLDPAGRIYLYGRFKDTLVLVHEWKVMPAELEAVLARHPLIETCVVVGTPDPQLPGCHAPKAFVKLVTLEQAERRAAAHELEPELAASMRAGDLAQVARHIYQFFAERTAREKHLRGGVRILDEFPRVGLLRKIDRKALQLLD